MFGLKPLRDAKFHDDMQEHLQTFIRWTVAPEESPTGRPLSREMLDLTAQIAAAADPKGSER